ncbi:unnamed protein product [Boreogadus saida]
MSLADQSQQWFPTSAQVTVLQARGLRIKGKNGTNDAYAIMQVAKDKFSTEVAEKSVAPMWKEQASFDLPPAHQGNDERGTLRVHVMHRALVGPDKPLGQAVVNLLDLHEVKSRNKTEWFKLVDKGGKADKERGEVLLDIQFMRNNMTASMFDLSGMDKSRSRLGKIKDKLRGKKKDGSGLDSVSAIVPSSFSQVLTDSEEELEEEEEEGAAGVEGAVGAAKEKSGKKKLKLKSLFSHKSTLKKNMSQSMSFLGPLPERNQTLSGSRSSGLNVEPSEGKKKFKFGLHKRSGSNDSKSSQASADPAQRGGPDAPRPGGHVYTEEPTARAGSRASSTFSLSSSGRGSMEDLHRGSVEGSFSSYDSLRVPRPQSSPWLSTKAAEEGEVEEGMEEEVEEEDVSEYEQRRGKQEEEKARQEEQMRIERRREEEEQRKRLDEERMRREELEKREIEEQQCKYQRDEEDRIRREREEEERFRREEVKRREVEEERERIKRMEEEEEKFRMKEEMVRIEKERAEREEKERREEERTRLEKEEEEKMKREWEEKQERIRIEKEKERLEEEYERERVRLEKVKEEEERRVREEEEEEERRVREEEEEEEEKMTMLQEREERRLREKELEDERFRMEKEERRVREEEEERLSEMQEREERKLRERELEEERFRMREKEEIRVREEEEERKVREEEARMSEMQEIRLRERSLDEERFRMEKERGEEERRVREEEEERMSDMQEKEERRVRERELVEERFKMEKEREEEERRVEEETTRIEKAKKRQEEERILMEGEERRRREVAEEEEQEVKRQEERERMRREEGLLEEERIKRQEQVRREEEERVQEQQRREDERRGSEEEGGELEEEFMTEETVKNTPFGPPSTHEPYLGPNSALTNKSPGGIESARRRVPVRSVPPSEDDGPPTPEGPLARRTADVPTARQSPASRRTPSPLFEPSNPFFEESESDEHLSGKKRPAPPPPSNQELLHDKPNNLSVSTIPSVSPLGGIKTSLHLDEGSDGDKDRPRAVRTAPQPPQRHGPRIEPISSKEKTVQTVHATGAFEAPQPSKNTKGPAPAKPNPNITKVSAQVHDGRPEHAPRPALSFKETNMSGPHTVTEQRPSTYGTNPFDEEDEEEEAQTPLDTDGSSSSRVRSLKTVRAPPPPEDKESSPAEPSRNACSEARVTVSSSVRPTGPPPTGDASETQATVQPRRAEAAAEQGGRVETAARPASVGSDTGTGPPTPSQRSHPVKPLRVWEQQSAVSSVSATPASNTPSEITRAGRNAVEVKEEEARGPFSQLTRGELILLLQKLQGQLTQRDHKISELEQYIDNLLVRIMEEEPSILMSMNALKH